MRIVLVTPFLPASRNGNAHTAQRWRGILRRLGHGVEMVRAWDGGRADAMVALHARRSHNAIARFAERCPERPLILILTGTDLYRDIRADADAQRALELAHRLVVLQDQGVLELPPVYRDKCRVIHQSAPALADTPRPSRFFSIGVVAHLREEKDPLRAALASRLLPASSRIRLWQAGGELESGMGQAAAGLQSQAPRWRWLGARPHGETRRRIARSQLLIVSSRMEGGANVICEAVSCGTPVLASDIPGNIGMLGEDYAGYYPLGDEAALADLMSRAETDPLFYRHLALQCGQRAPLFRPEHEAAAIADLLAEMT